VNNRTFLRLLGSFALMIAVTVAALDFAVTRVWEQTLRGEIESSLRQKTALFAARVAAEPQLSPQQLAVEAAAESKSRATIIATDGRILAESEANPERMENHLQRPEVQQALRGEVGMDRRRSHTTGEEFLYVAVREHDTVVRLAYPLRLIAESTHRARRTMLLVSVLVLVLAVLLAALLSWRTTRRLEGVFGFAARLAEGDFAARLNDPHHDELGSVSQALDSTAQQLDDSFRRLAESRSELEAVLNSMQEAVLAVSAGGNLQWVNRTMHRLLPAGVKLNAPVVQTVRDPDLLAVLSQTRQEQKPVSQRAPGIVPGRVFDVTAAPMPDGGAVAVLYDVTEFERVDKTRRDFIANVSHELRTPLTSIQGYAETLLDGSSDATSQREFLEIIRRNAARMTRLTEDLLELAKVESGEKKLTLEALMADELLEDAARHFREHQSGCGLELEVHNDSTKTVSADRDAVFQAFSNLIDNACKYAAGGKKLELGAHDIEGYVEFYVRDFGAGIPSEHLPRLFERFYRVDKARSRESGGTGLGLAIVKHIVRLHGGEVSAASEMYHGSTFRFTLPQSVEE
jgi:two-component system phosphate regulon sensor histidine kinase PhoR